MITSRTPVLAALCVALLVLAAALPRSALSSQDSSGRAEAPGAETAVEAPAKQRPGESGKTKPLGTATAAQVQPSGTSGTSKASQPSEAGYWPWACVDRGGDEACEYILEVDPRNVKSADGYVCIEYDYSTGAVHYVRDLRDIVQRSGED